MVSQKKKCVICETSEHTEEYLEVYSDRTQQPETLLRCCNCGLVYVNEPIRVNKSFSSDVPEDELESQWKKEFPDALDVHSPESWGVRNQELSDVVRWQYQSVRDLLGKKLDNGLRLVEIGCARGYLLAEIATCHPSTHLLGIEPSPIMARFAKKTGAEIVEGVVEDAELEPNSIDAVVGFGSFIQIRDPMSALNHLSAAMKKGGVILLDSPNDDSLIRDLIRFLYHHSAVVKGLGFNSVFERYLRLIYNPGRFYYYTPSTYARLLNLAGFEVIRVKMRQPRYLVYGRQRHILMKLASRAISFAEQLFSKESWIEVAAVKARGA